MRPGARLTCDTYGRGEGGHDTWVHGAPVKDRFFLRLRLIQSAECHSLVGNVAQRHQCDATFGKPSHNPAIRTRRFLRDPDLTNFHPDEEIETRVPGSVGRAPSINEKSKGTEVISPSLRGSRRATPDP
ncbi:hypothetical protein Bbelb_123380 [Branchiostoma belcheri]|nr:hypothetical protein Bbelb_123380 [Branchiostoma belcheri]